MARDYQVSLVLEDAAGERWAAGMAGPPATTTRRRAGGPARRSSGGIRCRCPQARRPATTTVTLAVYDAADPSGLDIRDVADNPAGKRVRLGPIRIEGRMMDGF